MQIIEQSSVDHTLPARRLRRNTLSLVNASPALTILGPDRYVENLAAGLGFREDRLVILRILAHLTPVTLIVVPSEMWGSPQDRLRLLELKADAAFADHRCILVPEGIIQRQPRLENARLIETSGTSVNADQRLALMAYLIEAGPSSLLDCAKAIQHDTPAAAILHLSAAGIIVLHADSHIGPDTIVELAGIDRPHVAV